MENKNNFGMPVKVYEELHEQLWELRYQALAMKDMEAGNILYCMGRIMQGILAYMPKVDEDLESEEKTDD